MSKKYDRKKATLPLKSWINDQDLFWQEVPENYVFNATIYEKLDEWLRNFKVNYDTIGFDLDVKTLEPIKGSALVIDKSMASTKFFEQLPALKDYKGTIIACDRALPTLIHAGIVPKIVCQVDSSYLCQYFLDVPEVKAKMPEMTCVFATTTHPITIRLFHGRKVFFQPFMGSWDLTCTLAKKANVSVMTTGGQVACLAWLLAVNLQTPHIGVFGVTNSVDDYFETEYPGVRHKQVKNKYGTFWVDPVYEYYNEVFLAYIKYAKEKHNIKTVNCTKGGILYSDYVRDMPLQEFVEKYT